MKNKKKRVCQLVTRYFERKKRVFSKQGVWQVVDKEWDNW